MHICNPRNPKGKQEAETRGSPDVLRPTRLRAKIAANTLFLSATKWKARTDSQGCPQNYAYTHMHITHTVTHVCTQTLYTYICHTMYTNTHTVTCIYTHIYIIHTHTHTHTHTLTHKYDKKQVIITSSGKAAGMK